MHLEILQKKIQEKNAVVGIIGLGYVGLPLALKFFLMISNLLDMIQI